jgi:hypothetical protein
MTPSKPNILPHTPKENKTKPEIDHIGGEATGEAGEEGGE